MGKTTKVYAARMNWADVAADAAGVGMEISAAVAQGFSILRLYLLGHSMWIDGQRNAKEERETFITEAGLEMAALQEHKWPQE